MRDSLTKAVEETIERHNMLLKGDTVLVALSGGPDSVCLLNILEELRSAYSLTICVAHLNHQIRGKAADRDAEFVRRTAEQKGHAFVESSADVKAFAREKKLSVEEAGRKLRYEFLLRSALSLGANRVAVGHNADDQAETILMRLIRGTGPHGLAGIPPVRGLGGPEGPKVIRPLINVWRTDIIRHVRARKLKYRRDATNESPEYLRNKIRLELLPHLQKEYNPRIKQRLASVASLLAAENDLIKGEAALLAEEVTIEREPGWIVFDADLLRAFHPALRKRIVLEMVLLAKPDAPMLEASHYADADALIRSPAGRLDLPGGLRLEVSAGAGLMSETGRRARVPRGSFAVPIGGKMVVPALNLIVRTKVMTGIKSPARLAKLCTPNRQYFDLDAVRVPLEIRFRRPGDSFRPLGGRGSKKLKDFFIDKKVPRFLRDRMPLLLSDGKIMWVMGHAIGREFRLRPGSTAALRVDYEG
jgi:tRNA(Ile)-lysidine synthase